MESDKESPEVGIRMGTEEVPEQNQPDTDESVRGEQGGGQMSVGTAVTRIEEPKKFAHLPKIGKLTVTSTYKDIIGPSFYRVWNDFLTFRYNTYVLDGGRGCVSGDTLIDTPNGKVAIKDFKGGVIYSYSGNKVVRAYGCKPIKYSPVMLYKVTFDNGAVITCTDGHRFLTSRGWKKTCELRKGSCVVLADGDLTSKDYARCHWFEDGYQNRLAKLYVVANAKCPVNTHEMDEGETYRDMLERLVSSDKVSDKQKQEASEILKDAYYISNGCLEEKVVSDESGRKYSSNIYTSIKSIEAVGEECYYDMFVPYYHNYVAEGIIHHNSLKSSAISVFIMCGLERDRKEALRRKKRGDKDWRHYLTHAVCYRKVFGTCEQSVYSQLEWAIDKLNLNGKWILKKSPLKIVRYDTGQMILFRGLDDPLKSKSLKAPFSFFRYLWFEEAAEFDGIEEIRNVSQSIHRGGHDFQTFYSYNPPETSACWINKEMVKLESADPTMKRYHSDYRTVPIEWLGKTFFAEAEVLKKANYRAWRHEYLGEITGNGGTVFPNVVAREISDEEISHYANLHWGCDFGTVDPTVLVGMEFDKVNYRLIIFREVYESNMMLDRMEQKFKEMHYGYEYIRADCAARQMIMELEARGLPMLRAEKGPDSIMHGVKWLQNLREIVIDPRRCPHTYDEFSVYEYEKSKQTGEFTSKLPDRNNHAIDAVRYAVEDLSGNGGVF